MEIYNVILRPIKTEKSSVLSEFEKKKYAFEVNKNANKHEILIAFESIFNITPEKINIVNRKSKAVRTGTKNPGFSKHKKIAYITLSKGSKLSIDIDEQQNNQQEKPTIKEKANAIKEKIGTLKKIEKKKDSEEIIEKKEKSK